MDLNEKQKHLAILEEIIEGQKKSLQIYVSRPNPNRAYLEKRNQENAELTDVFNYFNGSDTSEFWIGIEKSIKEITTKDPEIGGVTIKLLLGNNSPNFGYMEGIFNGI